MITRPTLECWNIVINDWKPSGEKGLGGGGGGGGGRGTQPFTQPVILSRGEAFWERVIWRPALRNVSEKFVIQFIFFLARFSFLSFRSYSYSWFWEKEKGFLLKREGEADDRKFKRWLDALYRFRFNNFVLSFSRRRSPDFSNLYRASSRILNRKPSMVRARPESQAQFMKINSKSVVQAGWWSCLFDILTGEPIK